MNFNEYYELYLSLHQNRTCRRLHFIGQIVTILYTCMVLATGMWIGLIFVPFIVYPFAWCGHFFFERNKPAAFRNPWLAKAADWRMFFDIIRGKIKL